MSEKHIIQEWANEAKTTIYLGKMDYEKKKSFTFTVKPPVIL